MPQSDHEIHVRRIQRALRILNRGGVEVREVFEDGIYGGETAGAVSDYQIILGLEPTGVVDKETWESLMAEAAGLIERNAPPIPIAPFVNGEKATCAGEECWAVYFAQSMLKFLSSVYSNFTAGGVSGVNDEATAENLRRLQSCAKTDYTDGTLDKTTWNALAELFSVAYREQ